MTDRLELPASWTVDATETEMVFHDSSFFTARPGRNGQGLPTPAEVTARSSDFGTTPQPSPVRFEHLDLIVKFGPCVVVQEALCLLILRKALSGSVPVPEVYGWKIEDGRVFI